MCHVNYSLLVYLVLSIHSMYWFHVGSAFILCEDLFQPIPWMNEHELHRLLLCLEHLMGTVQLESVLWTSASISRCSYFWLSSEVDLFSKFPLLRTWSPVSSSLCLLEIINISSLSPKSSSTSVWLLIFLSLSSIDLCSFSFNFFPNKGSCTSSVAFSSAGFTNFICFTQIRYSDIFLNNLGSFLSRYVFLAKKLWMYSFVMFSESAGCINITNSLNAGSFMFSM